MKDSKKNIDKIIKGIKDANLPQRDFVKMMETFHDPFKVLICCILSLRTNDLTTSVFTEIKPGRLLIYQKNLLKNITVRFRNQ